jgi:hypothetical protein
MFSNVSQIPAGRLLNSCQRPCNKWYADAPEN